MEKREIVRRLKRLREEIDGLIRELEDRDKLEDIELGEVEDLVVFGVAVKGRKVDVPLLVLMDRKLTGIALMEVNGGFKAEAIIDGISKRVWTMSREEGEQLLKAKQGEKLWITLTGMVFIADKNLAEMAVI